MKPILALTLVMILTISALETKQERTNLRTVCINSILFEQLAIFKSQPLNQRVMLYTKAGLTDKQSEITTDQTKIIQILSNLISNALKFTTQGYVEFGYTLESIDNSSYLQFYVKDTGIGIEPTMQNRIFDRFIQVETGLTRQFGGNGLGLSISKGFVELLGGKIWVESELEKGSSFYFTIPYNPLPTAEIKPLPETKKVSTGTILIAEDEIYNFLYFAELLNATGFELVHAKNGKEAVDICSANMNIDLVLMDIKMPIMDGQTAAKHIKDVRPELKIIAQSAYTLEQYKEKYVEYLFDDYIAKPINANLLLEKINRFIKV